MALLLCNMGGSGICTAQTNLPKPSSSSSLNHPSFPSPPLPIGSTSSSRSTHVARARRGLSSRTRRLENRGKKGVVTTPPQEEEEGVIFEEGPSSMMEGVGGGGGGVEGYSTSPPPKLQGVEPDFWEGPQWNALGFFVQYQWAFGIGFALIACGIAVATYNEGATDFKKTPVYKESIQSRELLEEPETSNSDVFEANPTEEAPSLE